MRTENERLIVTDLQTIIDQSLLERQDLRNQYRRRFLTGSILHQRGEFAFHLALLEPVFRVSLRVGQAGNQGCLVTVGPLAELGSSPDLIQ